MMMRALATLILGVWVASGLVAWWPGGAAAQQIANLP